MAMHTITLNLPETVYEQIQQAAEKAQRPVNDVLVEAVTAVAPVMSTASSHLRVALAHMAYCNDAALWQAARTTMSPEQRTRLATLHDHIGKNLSGLRQFDHVLMRKARLKTQL